MHLIVWEFVVRDGCEAEFERAYGHDGTWAQLFRTSGADFLGTELLRDDHVPRRYLTIDRWSDARAFVTFRRQHLAEYQALDERCDELTERETRVGEWTKL